MFLETRDLDKGLSSEGILLAAYLFVSYAIVAYATPQHYDNSYTTMSQLNGALLTSVYEKTIRLAPHSRMEHTTGQIQNLMSTDCRAVALSLLYIHETWLYSIQVLVAAVLIACFLGWGPALFFLLLLAICLPIQLQLASSQTKAREKANEKTDERIRHFAEAIRAIKLVKLYTWELPFIKRITHDRTGELRFIKHINFLAAWNSVLLTAFEMLTTFGVVAIYVMLGNEMTSSAIFPTIAVINNMSMLLKFFPKVVTIVTRARTSLSRLEKFLLADEINTDLLQEDISEHLRMEQEKIDISAENATLSWDGDVGSPNVTNITFSIPTGALVAIVGPTGSGKTTILSGLLREAQTTSGKLNVRNRQDMAFCDQTPFIQNATVRQNILFGKVYDEELYERVIERCSLNLDFSMLPAGDASEIGSRGINLSGGQRARISMARAAYSQKRICLLDDPFSAVDAFVGNVLFNSCLVSEMSNRTRLFTTNHLHLAADPQVDFIVVVKNGSMVEFGERATLLEDDRSAFSEMVTAFTHKKVSEPTHPGEYDADEEMSKQFLNPAALVESKYEDEILLPKVKDSTPLLHTAKDSYGALEAGKLIKEEKRDIGSVSVEHYGTYAKAIGLTRYALPVIVFLFVERLFETLVGVWLGVWTDQGGSAPVVLYITVLFAFAFACVLFSSARSFTMVNGTIRASRRLHEKLLVSIFGASSAFFYSTPEGRLINRFSSDIDKLDSLLGQSVDTLLYFLLTLMFTIGLMLWATPSFLIAVTLIGALLAAVQKRYKMAVVELRRLESLSYSPLYSHFSETLDGVQTLRAFDDFPRAMHANTLHADKLVMTVYAGAAVRRWFNGRTLAIGAILILTVTLTVVAVPNRALSAGFKGLILSYTISTFTVLKTAIFNLTETETEFNAVERISEYSIPRLSQEGNAVASMITEKSEINESLSLIELSNVLQNTDRQKLKRATTGDIRFESVEMRYRHDLQPALKDLCFTIKPGEHVGIVGRTGAGKTSAIHCLFRLSELSKGRILLDGVDIATMALQDLRSCIGVIPQEPVCFSGTIRSNLDMFGEHDDEAVKEALNTCGLADSMPVNADLDYKISENGGNLSIGQRQLLCLGRVLLKNSQVLVLDEATSSVSLAIDEQIQEILKTKLSHCTILMVAHRLQTVMQADKIIVMDAGRVTEVGKPSELLRFESQFSAMVEETGPETSTHLRHLALVDNREVI